MGATELKAEVHQMIDLLDEPFLKVVHSMLDTYVQQQIDPIVGYDIEGNPLYASEAIESYAKRVSDMQAGQKTSVEDLRKEAATW